MFVSLTRLRLRSLRYLLPFLRASQASAAQAQASPGFITGGLMGDRWLVFWTMTAWESEAAMKAYRGSGEHKRVMPEIGKWTDEAWVTHWEQESRELPDWAEAYRRLTTSGRATPLPHPSDAHAQGEFSPPRPLFANKLGTRKRAAK